MYIPVNNGKTEKMIESLPPLDLPSRPRTQ